MKIYGYWTYALDGMPSLRSRFLLKSASFTRIQWGPGVESDFPRCSPACTGGEGEYVAVNIFFDVDPYMRARELCPKSWVEGDIVLPSTLPYCPKEQWSSSLRELSSWLEEPAKISCARARTATRVCETFKIRLSGCWRVAFCFGAALTKTSSKNVFMEAGSLETTLAFPLLTGIKLRTSVCNRICMVSSSKACFLAQFFMWTTFWCPVFRVVQEMSQQTQREILARSDRDKPKFVCLVLKKGGAAVLSLGLNGSKDAGLRGREAIFFFSVGLG